ncbi:hypothetical protein QJQ45_021834 [Haematococcus lacustris]|nr:hypothetical protein QJQ45_021834 [Haematococcus lacustris]
MTTKAPNPSWQRCATTGKQSRPAIPSGRWPCVNQHCSRSPVVASHAASRTGFCCRAAHQSSASQYDVDAEPEARAELDPRDDDVLPEDLADALREAALATAEAIKAGNLRTQVEILMPEFWDPISGPIFPNKGDQGRLWRITRRFIEQLVAAVGCRPEAVNAVYPDAGVAALLAHQWSAANESAEEEPVARPITPEDELVVLTCPDPPGAEDALKTIRQVGEQEEAKGLAPRPVVLFNQRLSGGDVGLGLNARRLRDRYLNQFSITYSLRPIGEVGSVFRRYPGQWKVFLEDPELPGRYKLLTEQPSRPQGEYLDFLVQQALQPGGPPGEDGKPQAAGGAQGFLSSVQRTVSSLQYFMKSLTN